MAKTFVPHWLDLLPSILAAMCAITSEMIQQMMISTVSAWESQVKKKKKNLVIWF